MIRHLARSELEKAREEPTVKRKLRKKIHFNEKKPAKLRREGVVKGMA